MKMMQGTGLGEINRSIEKMSIGSTAGNYAPAGVTSNPHCGMPMTQTSVPLSTNNTTRRGSNWTNSTGGNGIEPTPQPGIGQHLNRLHRRAQQQQMMPTG